MRTISPAGLAKLATTLGTEPFCIVEIEAASVIYKFADAPIHGIQPKILELGELDNVVNVSGSGNAQSFSILLDDSDGTLKTLFDNQDVHQVTVRVYQTFAGLVESDKFLIFSGKMSSPITWSEADRTFRFSAVSQVEDREFGFSAEIGQFPHLPRDLVGKPWPVVFGKVLDIPALQVNQAVSGSTLCPVGILSGEDEHLNAPMGSFDCSQGMSVAKIFHQISHLSVTSTMWRSKDSDKADALLAQANDLRSQVAVHVADITLHEQCGRDERQRVLDEARGNGLGCNPVEILGGEDFPQHQPIWLNIGNGGRFLGTMSGNQFTITNREHAENQEIAERNLAELESSQCERPVPAEYFDYQTEVPNPLDEDDPPIIYRTHGFIICLENRKSRPAGNQILEHYWADAGSNVTIDGNEPITYIVSIIPGTVLAVKAYKTFDGGVRRLVDVPRDYYTIHSLNYGPVGAVAITTIKPLSSIQGQNFDDDLYVSFNSSVGPETTEILQWIITNYTDLGYDAASFAAAQVWMNPFPMNFAVLERKNTVALLQEIAFQARCALWLDDGVFKIKYLPAEPTSDMTVTVSDVVVNSVEVSLGHTEDLVTKMVNEWRLLLSQEEPSLIILRNNVLKYGTKEQNFDWFCYNQPDIVYKAATFWLIRLSKSWKRITMSVPLKFLQLETFDTVLLNIPPYVASGPVKAIVEECKYDSAANIVKLSCLCPVECGTMVQYPLFWPALSTAVFPQPQDVQWIGGGGPQVNATGNLPVGNAAQIAALIQNNGIVFVGGPNVIFGPQSDRGDRTPGDVGFTAQQTVITTQFATLDARPNPNLYLGLNYLDALPPPLIPETPNFGGDTEIDIRKTRVKDSDTGQSTTLSTMIYQISADNGIEMRTDVNLNDGTNIGPFAHQWDTDNNLEFGARIAFLE